MNKTVDMFARAMKLYVAYKTTWPEYRDLAARLGYSVGDLNARFSDERGRRSS